MLAPKRPIKHFLFPNIMYLRKRLKIDCILKICITSSFLSQFLFIHLNKKACRTEGGYKEEYKNQV